MTEIRFKLTKKQKDALAPFFRLAVNEARNGRLGVVMGQLCPTDIGEPMGDFARFGFVPNEVAVPMLKLLSDYNENERNLLS